MPRGRKKKKKSLLKNRNLMYIAAAALVVIVVLVIVLVPKSDTKVGPEITPAPIETVEPVATATAKPTPVPTVDPLGGLKKPKAVNTSSAILPKNAAGYLPVFEKAATEKKQIAITVDDLWQEGNVAKLLEVCDQTGAKLTFFPIGEAVVEDTELLKRIHASGHEIENHTYNHVNLYSLTTEEMIAQLQQQNALISKALGVDYQMHFMRPRGGNANYDKRMHNALTQLGYVGVAHWSVSGTPDMNTWAKNLKAGDVILFHATDKDIAKLVKLIPALVNSGYELVTMNTLFGLPENETYPLGTTTIGTDKGLDIAAINEVPYTMLKNGDCSYAVQRLQLRLKELGFYSKDCDGEYGSGTVTAVKAFQEAASLTADGIAGEQTQTLMFSDKAPVNTKENPVK